jgi:drug/metabolite transporter (DMT)-like permease
MVIFLNRQELKSNIFLFLAAAIWGFAFVAQRVGAKYLGAFSFNGVRFAIGSLSLIPLLIYFKRNGKQNSLKKGNNKYDLKAGAIAGCVLFLASSLQQIGIYETTAGKAAFITGLYIVLVPILGIFLKQHTKLNIWIGAVLAVVGLYFLSVNESFSISRGDFLEIIGAIFWAIHILLIDYFIKKVDAVKLSFIQFVTCSILSISIALITENITIYGLKQAIIPLLYGGVCSVGIAYTLQAVGQKHAKPSHAAIILSLESVFAGIGGILLLNEILNLRGFLGCTLMLGGMLLSQIKVSRKNSNISN